MSVSIICAHSKLWDASTAEQIYFLRQSFLFGGFQENIIIYMQARKTHQIDILSFVINTEPISFKLHQSESFVFKLSRFFFVLHYLNI